MKRERDEVMTSKMELAIENKRLKVTDYFVKFIMPNRMKLKHLRKILMNNNLTVKDLILPHLQTTPNMQASNHLSRGPFPFSVAKAKRIRRSLIQEEIMQQKSNIGL
jgi:hypothetical protein